MSFFQNQIVDWFANHRRALPWRTTKDPYKIWLSEIILQQTRVDQGLGYYQRFVAAFPRVENLAAAEEQEVLLLWQGLGYYSRARNLHHTAKTIVSKYSGVFPSSYEHLLQLKGIGPYSAAAIASIAFDLPHAVVDGNVYRVLSRYFGIATPIDSNEGKKEFFALANQMIEGQNPGIYNQALMEFGALHCKPALPLCLSCPLASKCVAHRTKQVADLPVKTKTIQQRRRILHYYVPIYHRATLIKPRPAGDIWQGLWEFPLVEGDLDALQTEPPFYKDGLWMDAGFDKNHKLTHQTLALKFFILNEAQPLPELSGFQAVPLSELSAYPFPIVLREFLNLLLEQQSRWQ